MRRITRELIRAGCWGGLFALNLKIGLLWVSGWFGLGLEVTVYVAVAVTPTLAAAYAWSHGQGQQRRIWVEAVLLTVPLWAALVIGAPQARLHSGWLPAIAMFQQVATWIGLRLGQRERGRFRDQRCKRCGYDCTGVPARSSCPECGKPLLVED